METLHKNVQEDARKALTGTSLCPRQYHNLRAGVLPFPRLSYITCSAYARRLYYTSPKTH